MRSATLLCAFLLVACEQPDKVPNPSPSPPTEAAVVLPLSPGVKVASLVSGGIAGLSDSVQVTYDWNLIVVTSDASFVRRVTAEEQKALREAQEGFATLYISEGNEPGTADGMGVTLVARGWGEGEGDAEDSVNLGAILSKMRAAAPGG